MKAEEKRQAIIEHIKSGLTEAKMSSHLERQLMAQIVGMEAKDSELALLREQVRVLAEWSGTCLFGKICPDDLSVDCNQCRAERSFIEAKRRIAEREKGGAR